MKLRSLDIDGFGLLERVSSGELPAGLVVVFSADEQRKAAVLGFVRGMLFGLHNGNWPLAGAPDGAGALVLEGPQGAYCLRRNAAGGRPSLTFADGRIADAEELAGLLAGAANGATRRVFDVALAELRAFAQVNGAPAPGAVWHMPVGGSRGAEAAEQLQAGAARLLGSGNARLDLLVAELESVEQQLRAAEAREAEYAERLRREHELRGEVGHLCGELAEQRRARERFLLLEELWPLWSERWDAQGSLEVLEPIDDFPDEAMSLVDASRALAEALQEERRLELDLERAQRGLAELQELDERHTILAELEEMCGELPLYRSKLSAFATARARHDELSRLLPESARRVGERGDTASFDPARLDLQEARRWHVRAQQLAEREAATRAALETTRATLRHLRGEQDKAVREGDPTSPTMNPLDRRWLSLWRLRRNVDELWSVQSQGEAKARLAEERDVELRELPHRHWRAPPRWLRVLMWLLIGVAFAGAFLSVRSDQGTRTMLMGSLAFLGMIADLTLAWRGSLARLRNNRAQAEEDRLRWELAQAHQSRDERWRRAGEIARRIEDEAALLGLAQTPDDADIDRCEATLWRESTARAEVGVLAQIAIGLGAKLDEEEMMAAQLTELREAHAQADADWVAWKLSVGLPEHLDQEQLTTYLCEFDRWREMHREAERTDGDLVRLAPEIEAWENRARAALAGAGIGVSENLCGRELAEQLGMLRESARRSAQRLHRRAEFERSSRDLALAIESCRARTAQCGSAVEHLARAAGTTDHAEFDRRRRLYDRRRQLRGEIARHEAELDKRLAHLAAGERESLRELLAGGDRALWDASIRRSDETLRGLERRLEEVSKLQIEAAAACRRLEESTETVQLRHQRAALHTEIAECAAEWRRLSLAAGLIETALVEFGRERQTALLAAASQVLHSSSHGRFTRVTRASGGGELCVVDAQGQHFAVPAGVEPGVAEQLYLSLHLGVARECARRGAAPPLLLDDVLRDLDDAQGSAMAEEVARLAADHQVLFFTAHQPTLERLRAVPGAARVVEV